MLNLIWNEEDAKKSYIAQGIEEGIEKGIEEGRVETTLELVKNLMLAKTPLKYIIQATGLTKDEIIKISSGQKQVFEVLNLIWNEEDAKISKGD